MRFKACSLFDAGKPCGGEANMAKYLAAKASWEAANTCLQTHGGFGFAHEYDVERKFRETRLYQVAPISTNLISPTSPSTCWACRGLPDRARPLGWITVVSLERDRGTVLRGSWRTWARASSRWSGPAAATSRAYDTRTKGLASHFVWVNRSEESLTLDLKNPDALQVLMDLLARADVLVQNLAPGAAERMGLGYERLRALNPRLVACDISGYGNDGPYRDKKAYDLLIQSEAGFLSVTGTPDEPSKAGISIADIAAGMYAYSSVLAALMQRQKTGEGSHVDISMLEALGEWMGFPMYYAYEGARAPPRSPAAHATIYPYGPFEAGDGKTVMLGLQNEREWKVFCDKVLLQPALAATRASTTTAGATPTGRR